jgi:hypothetical protein
MSSRPRSTVASLSRWALGGRARAGRLPRRARWGAAFVLPAALVLAGVSGGSAVAAPAKDPVAPGAPGVHRDRVAPVRGDCPIKGVTDLA